MAKNFCCNQNPCPHKVGFERSKTAAPLLELQTRMMEMQKQREANETYYKFMADTDSPSDWRDYQNELHQDDK